MDNILKKTEICLDTPVANQNDISAVANQTVQPNTTQSISAPNTGIGGDSILLLALLITILATITVYALKKNKRFVMFAFAAIFGAISFGALSRVTYATIPGCQNVGYSKYEVVVRVIRDGYIEEKVVKLEGTGDQAKDAEVAEKIREEIRSRYYDAPDVLPPDVHIKSPNWDDEDQIYEIEYDTPSV